VKIVGKGVGYNDANMVFCLVELEVMKKMSGERVKSCWKSLLNSFC